MKKARAPKPLAVHGCGFNSKIGGFEMLRIGDAVIDAQDLVAALHSADVLCKEYIANPHMIDEAMDCRKIGDFVACVTPQGRCADTPIGRHWIALHRVVAAITAKPGETK